jgi:hypothetical protein
MIVSGSKFLTDWSPDGRFIAFNSSSQLASDDMWLLSVTDGKASLLLGTPASERDTVFSSDGRCLRLCEFGPAEVYVRAFPDRAENGRSRRTADAAAVAGRTGALLPRDGLPLTAVPVRAGVIEKGTPRELFGRAPPEHRPVRRLPDGQRPREHVVTEKASTPLTR